MNRIGTLTFNKTDIMPLVDIIKSLYTKESVSEVFNGVYVEPQDGSIRIKACSYAANVDATVPATCSVGQPFLLHGRRFCEAVKAIPGDTFTISDHPSYPGRALMQAGQAKYDLVLRDPNGYPVFMTLKDMSHSTTLAAEDLRTMVSIGKIGTDEKNNEPKFHAVGFVHDGNKFEVVSTNGSRIVVATKEMDTTVTEPNRVFVSRTNLKHVEDVLRGASGNITVGWTDKVIILSMENIVLGCLAQTFSFPNYQKVLQSGEASAVNYTSFERATFADALRFVTLNAQIPSDSVEFARAPGGDGVLLRFSHPDFGDSEIVVETENTWPEAVCARFNQGWLAELVAASGGDRIGLRFKDEASAWLFTDPALKRDRGIDFRYSMLSKKVLASAQA